MKEDILDPQRRIIDPHHHLWDWRHMIAHLPDPRHPFMNVPRRTPRYLLDELLADIGSGHNIRATVFMECGAMYRAAGAPEMAPVGETEFVNGIAAMGASGIYGEARPCLGIVGHADLNLGSRAAGVLEAHVAAGGGRFRGIRHTAAYDPDPLVLGPHPDRPPGLYMDAKFREGFACLSKLGLSFDAFLLEPQIGDLTDLAQKFPDTLICLDHIGTPLGIGAYAGKREERFGTWRDKIKALAKCPNVSVKLGGIAMPFAGFPTFMSDPPASSEVLAKDWRPYFETCIEAFTPKRAMFESNFPVDALTCDYRTLWNAFKRLAQAYSEAEKHELFFGAAARFYRVEV
jgi:predicted TIM-barrel fold metal-dependent hydrolase